MTNRNLIRWFLNFNILIANEFTCFNLKNQLALNLILYTFHTWAFNKWSKLLLLNNLINFKTTSIACIVSNLNAWFHITASCNNSFDDNKGTNCISFDLSHLYHIFLRVLTWSNTQVISSFQLRWNSQFLWFSILCLIWFQQSLSNHGLICIYRIKSSLSHLNII
jgi:hypothetical protein